jgi:hypothetical protein
MDNTWALETLKAMCSAFPLEARRITYLSDGSPAVIYNDEARTEGKAVILVSAAGQENPVGVIAAVKRIGPRYVLDGSDQTVRFKGWLFAVAREAGTSIEKAEEGG